MDPKVVDKADLEFDRYLLSGEAKASLVRNVPDGVTGPAIEVTVDPNSTIVLVIDDRELGIGSDAKASFVVWKTEGVGEIRARISRFGGKGENEQTVVTRNVGQDLVSVTFTHRFEHKHLGARLQIDTRTERETFLIAKAALSVSNPGI